VFEKTPEEFASKCKNKKTDRNVFEADSRITCKELTRIFRSVFVEDKPDFEAI